MIPQEKVSHPMNIERIAVIIPAYNVQKYIKECINSVLAQTYQHFTIFVVDDGSIDTTPAILSEYQKLDSRIKIFHKENSGASSARNFALSEIKRSKESFTYLFFLDSDDVIEPTFFQKAVSALQQSKADLAVCSVKEFTKNSVRQQPKPHRQILTKDEFAQLHFGIGKLGGTSVSYCFLCNKFFRYSMVIGSLFNRKISVVQWV